MKQVKILNPKPQINWNKPQWLISESHGIIVLTTGEHEGERFTGTCMPCEIYPNGSYSNDWTKKYYSLLTFDIPFTISNE